MNKMGTEAIDCEAYKRVQYSRADDRSEDVGLGRACVLCYLGVPGGSHIADQHHEIVPKSALPGRGNRETLFALENIAPACAAHHAQLGHVRLVWLKAMVVAGLTEASLYRVEPFSSYWEEGEYPPALTCFGRYGTGTGHFQLGASLPESLHRLYKVANPSFDALRFCEFCKMRVPCDKVTAAAEGQVRTLVSSTVADAVRGSASCDR